MTSQFSPYTFFSISTTSTPIPRWGNECEKRYSERENVEDDVTGSEGMRTGEKLRGEEQQCSAMRARWELWMRETKKERGEGSKRTGKMVCGCQATIDNQIPKHRACDALPSLQAWIKCKHVRTHACTHTYSHFDFKIVSKTDLRYSSCAVVHILQCTVYMLGFTAHSCKSNLIKQVGYDWSC